MATADTILIPTQSGTALQSIGHHADTRAMDINTALLADLEAPCGEILPNVAAHDEHVVDCETCRAAAEEAEVADMTWDLIRSYAGTSHHHP